MESQPHTTEDIHYIPGVFSEDQEITGIVKCTYTLVQNHLKVSAQIHTKEIDDKLGIDEDNYYHNEVLLLKQDIVGTLLRVNSNTKVWALDILASSRPEITLYFKIKKEAFEASKRINDWVLDIK